MLVVRRVASSVFAVVVAVMFHMSFATVHTVLVHDMLVMRFGFMSLGSMAVGFNGGVIVFHR